MSEHGPLGTAMGKFVERANGGLVSQGAVVFDASDIGLSELPLGMFEGTPTVDARNVSLVAPGGSPDGKVEIKIAFATDIGGSMLLVPGEALGVEEIVPLGDAYVLDLASVLPAQNWVPDDDEDTVPSAGTAWLAGGGDVNVEELELAVEKVERTRSVVVTTGPRSFADIFGVEPAALSARPVESGESFAPKDVLAVMPGDNVSANWPEDAQPLREQLSFADAVPRPAPMGGVSFGVAVLSTPNANVADNATNPLSYIDTDQLLERDAVQNLLAQIGFEESTSIRLEAGPERVRPSEGPQQATLLGTETDIESYIGVLGGGVEGWGIGVHLVRADTEDHVIVVGMHRHPLGSSAGAMDVLRESSELVEARRLVAETAAQLQ